MRHCLSPYPLVKFKGMMGNKKHAVLTTWRSVCRVHNRKGLSYFHSIINYEVMSMSKR